MSFRDTLTPKNKQNWDYDIPNKLDLTKGYFITGSQGTGKTVIAIQFVKSWLATHKYEYETNHCKFITFLDIVKNARNTFKDGDEGWLARRLVIDLKEYQLLVIDDLGVEKQTEFVQEIIYDLINYRYEHFLQTIITSNFTLSEIGQKYHARIASRIAEMCSVATPTNKKDLRIV